MLNFSLALILALWFTWRVRRAQLEERVLQAVSEEYEHECWNIARQVHMLRRSAVRKTVTLFVPETVSFTTAVEQRVRRMYIVPPPRSLHGCVLRYSTATA